MQKIGDIPNTRADINGEFTDGNVAGGVPPTILPAEWFNTLQRELINVLTAAGIQPDSEKFDQVAKAVSKLIADSGSLKTVNNFSEIKAAGTTALANALSNLGLGTAAKLNANIAGGVALFSNALNVANDLIEIKNKGEVAKINTRINIGCGSAAARDVGTGAGQIPDMSAWSFVKNADNSKWTLTLPNGFLLQKCTVVTPSPSATINAVWLTPFPIECLGVWGVIVPLV